MNAMHAVDTNVLVRFLTRDDPEQAARARAAITSHAIWVPLTVLLETEWVLRRSYRLSMPDIAGTIRRLAGLPMVTLEHADRVAAALDLMEKGLDMADALHVAGAAGCTAFLTFDADLIRWAERTTGVAVRAP